MNFFRNLMGVCRNVCARIILATSIVLIAITAVVFFIEKRPVLSNLTVEKTEPFLRILGNNEIYKNFDMESFFLPTKYNTLVPSYEDPQAEICNPASMGNKPIFSELDRLRIFRAFTNRFSESEYWTISNLELDRRAKNGNER